MLEIAKQQRWLLDIALGHLTLGRAASSARRRGPSGKGSALWLSRSARFGEGELERLLAAHALFKSRGIEVQVAADLRDGEGDGAEAGGEGLWEALI